MTSPVQLGVEEELMMRAQSGDRHAFRELTRAALPRALRVAKNVLLSDGDAEDVAQEASLRAWRNASSYDPKRSKFSTWLYRIVVNLAIDRRRAWRRQPTEDIVIDMADGQPDAETRLIDHQLKGAVRSAIADLPARQRTAVSLFYLNGCSIRESAEIMRTNEVAFQALLARARKSLKTLLDDVGG